MSVTAAIFKVEGATKLYFTHYSWVVIILFNKDLCRSVFSTISFRKLVFRLSVLSVFCFGLNVLKPDIKNDVLSSFKKVLLLCKYVLTL